MHEAYNTDVYSWCRLWRFADSFCPFQRSNHYSPVSINYILACGSQCWTMKASVNYLLLDLQDTN